jgi:hypothetical protein
MSAVPMSDQDRLTGRLGELRGERSAAEVTLTKEDLAGAVEEWLSVARAHAAGSSRLVLGGQASGDHLAQVLFEDRLADEGLAGRLVARLGFQGFGELSDRQKKQRLGKLDEQIAKVTAELREARKQDALERVEAEFAGEAA